MDEATQQAEFVYEGVSARIRVCPRRRVRMGDQRPAGEETEGRGHVLRADHVSAPGISEPERKGQDAGPGGAVVTTRRQADQYSGEKGLTSPFL